MAKGEIPPTGNVLSLPEPPGKKASDYIKAYTTNFLLFGIVRRIAQEVATIKLHLYKKKIIRGKPIPVELVEHEVLSLLHYVNDFTTFSQLIMLTQIYLDTTGEAYWALLGPKEGRKPRQIWVLRPDWVKVYPSPTEFIDYYGYQPWGWGKEVKFEKNEIIPFKEANPMNPYRGLGTIKPSAVAVDTLDFLMEWNRNFFFNAAVPSLIFMTDKKMKEAEIRRFLTRWYTEYVGRKKAHKVAILTGGMDFKTISPSFKDMDFPQLKGSVINDILVAYGIPKTAIGLTEDVNRATSFTAKQVFAESCIKPRMMNLVTHLNEFLLPHYETKTSGQLFFDFDDPAPEDVETKLKIYENGLRNGWLTINEVRERENLPRVEGGDSIYLPFNLTPVGSVIQGAKGFVLGLFGKKKEEEKGILRLDIQGKKPRRRELVMPIPPKRLIEYRAQKIKEKVKPDLVKLVSELLKYKNVEKAKEEKGLFNETQKEIFWKQMVAKTDVWEQVFKDKLRGLFQEQQEEVMIQLANVKKSVKSKQFRDWFDLESTVKTWKAIFAPLIKKIVEERGEEILYFLGVPSVLDLTKERAIKFLEEEGLAFVLQVNETTRDKLRKTLAEGLEADEGISELKKRIQEVYREANTSRAERIARTEVLRATNFATDEGYRQSGIVEGKEWVVALDERTCPACMALDGKKVALDKEFVSGVFYPPLHPSCRCTIVPIV